MIPEIVIGLLMFVIVEITKRYNVDVKVTMTVLAIFFWLLYQGFVFFVPETFQENVIEFIVGAVGTITILYNAFKVILSKDLLKKE